MESSRIKINEATLVELQRLKGVGPKRAEYILLFLRDVGPITNVFDLATAANISVKIANGISDQIDWNSHGSNQQISFWPLIITSVACLWLLGLAYSSLLAKPGNITEFFFSISICLMLTGSLSAAADIVLASAKKIVNETTRLFWFGITLFSAGLTALTGLTTIGLLTNLGPELSVSLNRSMLFVIMALIVFWVMYGPAIILRWMVGGSSLLLNRYTQIYEWSHPALAVIASAILLLGQSFGSLEEIFAIWTITILAVKGIELTKGRSAFTYTLSNRDRERYGFLIRHQLTIKPNVDSRLIAILYFASTAILTLLLLRSFIQP